MIFPCLPRVFQTSNVDIEGIDVRQLLKEKVKLEGQLEMLEVETRQAIRDRAELQTQVLQPYSYVSLRLRVQNAVPGQPCVGKLGISLVLPNFLHCNFRLWFKTP